MAKIKNKGFAVEMDLTEYGHKGYCVECVYYYNKRKEKYVLSMWITIDGLDERYKIDGEHIDTQFISGTRETIRDNVDKLLNHAASIGFFDLYIERLEYVLECCTKGNELIESERVSA